MVAVPELTPVTTPEELPTEAITGAEDTHVPPDGVEDSGVMPLAQTTVAPVIAVGPISTVTTL